MTEAEQKNFDDWLDAQDEIIRLESEHADQIASLQDALLRVKAENGALLDRIETQKADSDDKIGPSATERKSLLTIAIAAAVDGYGYNPADNKSPVASEIAKAAHRLGLSITDDTVRKYLKEAREIRGFDASSLPQRKPKSGRT